VSRTAVRRLLIGLVPLVLFALVVDLPPASAGGSWLTVVEVSEGALPPPGGGPAWAAVGATVRMRGGFCSGQQANPSEGPWFAYLRPATGGASLLLGPAEIVTSEGNACPWVATVSFAVPEVLGGSYWVDVCDEGCSTGVGDLSGGYLVVASSENEAKLMQQLTTLRLQYKHVRRNAAIFQGRMEALEERISDARHAARRSAAQVDEASASHEQAVAALVLANQAAAHSKTVSERWRLIALALAIALAISILVIAVSRRRRRHAPAILTDANHPPSVRTSSSSLPR
jgi:hypothetical protein